MGRAGPAPGPAPRSAVPTHCRSGPTPLGRIAAKARGRSAPRRSPAAPPPLPASYQRWGRAAVPPPPVSYWPRPAAGRSGRACGRKRASHVHPAGARCGSAMDPLRAQQLAAELEVDMMADMYNRCAA